MKKLLGIISLAIVLVLLLGSCCAKHISHAKRDVSVSRDVLLSSGAIVIASPFGDLPVGSATFVKSEIGNVVITAEHVAEIQDSLPIPLKVCAFGDMTDCTVLERNYILDSSMSIASDWAIFRIAEFPESVKPARVANRLPDIGEEVIICGIPQGQTPWLSYGHVGYVWEEESENVFGVDGFAFFGSSGGGVFDKSGRLIGITSAIGASRWGPQEDKVFVTPIANINFL